jgi:DNA-binding IclR family transcriptional regulator
MKLLRDEGVNVTTDQQAGIDSIETGMCLLMALAERRSPQMLKTIASDADMAPAKAHRYLVSFMRTGHVEKEPSSGFYRLGPSSLQLGLLAIGGIDYIKLGSQLIEELRDELNQTMAMMVWGNHGSTVVRIEDASLPVSINSRPGTVLPLLASASGQVFAAFLPYQSVSQLLMEELAANRRLEDPRLVTSADKAQAILAEVRRRGIGRVTGETTPGVHAICVPVFDSRGTPVVALACMGLGGQHDFRWNGETARRLKDAADDLSRRLGYSDDNQIGRLKLAR